MTILLTGGIDSGKTTFVRTLCRALARSGKTPAGLLCPAERPDGEKTLYLIEDIATGERRPLLRRTARGLLLLPGGFPFGRAVLRAARRAPVVFIDEFGPVELSRRGFYRESLALTRRRRGKTVIVVRRALVERSARALGLPDPLLFDLETASGRRNARKAVLS